MNKSGKYTLEKTENIRDEEKEKDTEKE